MDRMTIRGVAAFAFVVLASIGCSKEAPPDLAKARTVMNAVLDAEKDHRGSHGGYWRDSQAKMDPKAAMKSIGVDLAAAGEFDFVTDPPEGGYDPKLRIVARGRGAHSNVSLTCVLDAAAEKPTCTESGAAAP